MAEKKKNVSGTEIKSSGKALKNEKSEKTLKELKAKAAANEKKVAAKRAEVEANKKKSEKESSGKKSDLTGAAVAVGGALLGGLAKTKKSGKKIKWGMIIIIAVVVIGGLIFLGPKIGQLLSAFSGPSDLMPDEVMGYNKIDFQNAILGEAREKQELIVMEQDVQVDSTVSNALANIEIFKKTKTIHTFGTGVYTVDMSKIDNEHISVDETAKTVTVTIPHAILQYVNVDVNQTSFEDTEHAILGFGDLKLTPEQQNVLDQSIDDVMREELNAQALFDKADEIAVLKVQEIFQPLVSAVSEEFLVVVVQP